MGKRNGEDLYTKRRQERAQALRGSRSRTPYLPEADKQQIGVLFQELFLNRAIVDHDQGTATVEYRRDELEIMRSVLHTLGLDLYNRPENPARLHGQTVIITIEAVKRICEKHDIDISSLGKKKAHPTTRRTPSADEARFLRKCTSVLSPPNDDEDGPSRRSVLKLTLEVSIQESGLLANFFRGQFPQLSDALINGGRDSHLQRRNNNWVITFTPKEYVDLAKNSGVNVLDKIPDWQLRELPQSSLQQKT